MRITYYEFPDGTSEKVLLDNGCAVHWKDGSHSYPNKVNGIHDEDRFY